MDKDLKNIFDFYNWCEQNCDTAIAQSAFRFRRIFNRAHLIQLNCSGGKDSSITFFMALNEYKYRKYIIEHEKNYEYKDIHYDDFENFDKDDYYCFENINMNMPYIYCSTQDPEIIYSSTRDYIINEMYGKFNKKLIHPFFKCLQLKFGNVIDSNFISWQDENDKILNDIKNRTNYNIYETGIDISKNNLVKEEDIPFWLWNWNKEYITEIDGESYIPNWGFGSRNLKISKNGWSFIGQKDESGSYPETKSFSDWIISSVPDKIPVDYTGNGHYKMFETTIYNIVSIRGTESPTRNMILKSGNYFTGEYGYRRNQNV